MGHILSRGEKGAEALRALLSRLPAYLADALPSESVSEATEIRARVGERVEIRYGRTSALLELRLDQAQIDELVLALADQSLYACEAAMREGFFTIPGGFRVGVTGRYATDGETLQRVTSVCARVSRSLAGAADKLYPHLFEDGHPVGALILSPPRMGKTTMLRAAIRRLSADGFLVAVADERGELDTEMGARTDVASYCPKRIAIPRLIRALAPDVVATDELGDLRDAEAIRDAAQCGVVVLATAHAASYDTAMQREGLRAAILSGAFQRFAELGGAPGRLRRVLGFGGVERWAEKARPST